MSLRSNNSLTINSLVMEITILGEPVFEFSSFQDWVNRGQRLYRPFVQVYGKDHAVHLFDSKGHLLICGSYIRTADELGNTPFRAYDLKRP
jgi:hypothetical protein